MPRRFVDLSVSPRNGHRVGPADHVAEIEYLTHARPPTGDGVLSRLSARGFAGRRGLGCGCLQIATHNGTHLDAPYHHHSTMNNGERAITIDEVPLEWCLNPGVKLDFRHFDDGYVVTPPDVEAELQRSHMTCNRWISSSSTPRPAPLRPGLIT